MPKIGTIEKWVYGGESLVRDGGKVVFLHGGVPGDTVEYELTKENKSFSKGRVLRVLEDSPHRRHADCGVFGVCGGCQWLSATEEFQHEAKAQMLRESLRRLRDDLPIQPLLAPTESRFYRSRATFHGWDFDGEWELGFFAASSREVVPTQVCPLLEPLLQDAVNAYRAQFAGEIRPRRLVACLGSRDASLDSEIVVDFWETRNAKDPGLHRRWTQGAFENGLRQPRSLYGRWKEMAFAYSVTTFMQNNFAGLATLIDLVDQWREEKGVRKVLDCYAGVGVYGFPFMAHGGSVIGVEGSDDAHSCAVTTGRLHGWSEERWQRHRTPLERFGFQELPPLDGVITNPPRTGMTKAVTEALGRFRVPYMLYVSCDPTTLARDLQMLLKHGYAIESIQPLDLFPQTYHFETVVRLKFDA